MKPQQVIITVRGGTVQSVHVSPDLQNANIILLDFDCFENDADFEFSKEQKQAEQSILHDEVIETIF